MHKLFNLLNYLRTLRIIYQKALIGKIPFNKGNSYTKFVIISQPRVGSTLLLSYLNNHPHIIAKNEIVREKNENPLLRAVAGLDFLKKNIFHEYSNSIKAVGFKFFYEHQLIEHELFEYLLLNNSLKIIHLKRKDLLKCYVSNRIAGKTQVWSQTKFQKNLSIQAKRIMVDPNCFKVYKNNINRQYAFIKECFKAHPVLELYYEDLIMQPTEELAKILSFLGVKHLGLRTLFNKQNPEDLEELIINYQEIAHL